MRTFYTLGVVHIDESWESRGWWRRQFIASFPLQLGGVIEFGDSSGLTTVTCPCREASSWRLSEVRQSPLVLRRQQPSFADWKKKTDEGAMWTLCMFRE
jgi:hypothetical protein